METYPQVKIQNKTKKKLEKLSFLECREKKIIDNARLWIQRVRIQPKTSPSASRSPRRSEQWLKFKKQNIISRKEFESAN